MGPRVLVANQTGVFGDTGDVRDRVVASADIGGSLGTDQYSLLA